MADTEEDDDKKEQEQPITKKKKRKRKTTAKKKKLKNKKDKKQKQSDKKQKQIKKQNNKKQKQPHRAHSEEPIGLFRHGHRHSKQLGIDRTAVLQQLLTTSSKEYLIDPKGKRIPSTEDELEQAKKEIHRMKLQQLQDEIEAKAREQQLKDKLIQQKKNAEQQRKNMIEKQKSDRARKRQDKVLQLLAKYGSDPNKLDMMQIDEIIGQGR